MKALRNIMSMSADRSPLANTPPNWRNPSCISNHFARRMFKSILATLVLIVVPVAAAYWYLHDTDAHLPSLRTAAVERGDLQFTIDATGTVEPEEVVDVGAQVAGKIQSLGVDPRDAKRSIDYGSPVNVGTVLARIDDSLYQSDVEQAQAQVDSAQALAESTAAQVLEAQANVERAEKDLLQMRAKLFQANAIGSRAQGLWKSSPGAISESDYDLGQVHVRSGRCGRRRGRGGHRPGQCRAW